MKMNEQINKEYGEHYIKIAFGIWYEKACSKLFQHVPYPKEMNNTGNDVSFGAKLRVIFEMFTISHQVAIVMFNELSDNFLFTRMWKIL